MVQTFLPYPRFSDSANCLDRRRLGKQRVEAWQIYLALTKDNYGWRNHPAVKMWRGCEYALLIYGEIICNEWIDRGYKDSMRNRFLSEKHTMKKTFINSGSKGIDRYKTPAWLMDLRFHQSHQSNLLRKDPTHYRSFFQMFQIIWSMFGQ